MSDFDQNIVALVDSCIEQDPYINVKNLQEKIQDARITNKTPSRSTIYELITKLGYKKQKHGTKWILSEERKIEVEQSAKDFINSLKQEKPDISNDGSVMTSDNLSPSEHSLTSNMTPKLTHNPDYREKVTQQIILETMKFLDTSIINQCRFKPPKILRVKKWLEPTAWNQFIMENAMELPRCVIDKEVSIGIDGNIKVEDYPGIFEFDKEVNQKHFFKKIIMVIYDGLVEKLMAWTKDEPICVEDLELKIEEDVAKKNILPHTKFLNALPTLLNRHIITNYLRIEDDECPLNDALASNNDKKTLKKMIKERDQPDCSQIERPDNKIFKYLVGNPGCLRLPKVKNISLFFGCRKMHTPLPPPEAVVRFLFDQELTVKNRKDVMVTLNYDVNGLIKLHDEITQQFNNAEHPELLYPSIILALPHESFKKWVFHDIERKRQSRLAIAQDPMNRMMLMKLASEHGLNFEDIQPRISDEECFTRTRNIAKMDGYTLTFEFATELGSWNITIEKAIRFMGEKLSKKFTKEMKNKRKNSENVNMIDTKDDRKIAADRKMPENDDQVEDQVFEKIIEWCKTNNHAPIKFKLDPMTRKYRHTEFSSAQEKFFHKNRKDLIDIVIAADYLKIMDLLHFCCAYFAQKIENDHISGDYVAQNRFHDSNPIWLELKEDAEANEKKAMMGLDEELMKLMKIAKREHDLRESGFLRKEKHRKSNKNDDDCDLSALD